MTRTTTAAIIATFALAAALLSTPLSASAATANHASVDQTSASQNIVKGEDEIYVPGGSNEYTGTAHSTGHSNSVASNKTTQSTSSASDAGTATAGDGAETIYVSVVSATATTSDDKNSGMTAAAAKTLVAGINKYWATQSNGAVSVVLGGFETRSFGASSCDAGTVLGDEEQDAFGGKFANDAWEGTNDHLLVLTEEACGNQAFGTVGGVGGEMFSGNGMSANLGLVYLLHEFGHNLGFQHADASICENTKTGDAPIADFSFASSTCPTTEYDDYLDIMGYTVKGATPNLSAPQRIAAGWLQNYSVVTNATKTKKITLKPLGSAGGTQAAEVTDPSTGDVYYVEYRAAVALDKTSAEFHYQKACGSSHGGYRICNLGSSKTGIVRVLRSLPFSNTLATGTTVQATGAVSSTKSRDTHFVKGKIFTNFDKAFSIKLVSLSASKGAAITITFSTTGSGK